MTPITGRLRFHGTQGTQPKVDGLQFYTTFTIASTSFGTAEKKSIEQVIASNGYSPYYYAEFDNAQRQLHVTFDAYTGALRSFPQGVLAKGQGGYITMPTLASHAGWMLVNADRQQITVPTVSATPTVQKYSHKSASLSATITNSGNGRISDTGFLIGTSTNRAEATITAKGGTSETITATATGLTEKTTYYVWAYATNQAGTGYSNSYATFTTKETPPDTNFDIDDFGDDNNWD